MATHRERYPDNLQENPQHSLILCNLVPIDLKSYKYQLQRLLVYFLDNFFMCVVENKGILGRAPVPLIVKDLP